MPKCLTCNAVKSVQGFVPSPESKPHAPSTTPNISKRAVSRKGKIVSLPGMRQFKSVWVVCDECDASGYVTEDTWNLQEAYLLNDVYDKVKAREKEMIDGQKELEDDSRAEEVLQND